jgi:TPR repeat protein
MLTTEAGTANAAPASADADGRTLYEIAMLCAAGVASSPDRVAAHKWLNIAVAKGYAPAVEARAELAMEMSEVEKALALREARMWLTRH